MTRYLKPLCLAMLAALAISAVVASAAMAVPQFTASKYPATVAGSSSERTHVFNTEAGKVECDADFTGSLSGASSTLTLKPTYTNCRAFGFAEATVSSSHCWYVLHATEKVGATSYKSHVDIACEFLVDAIEITAGTCKMTIGPQNGLTTFATSGALGSLTVNPEISNFTYVVTQDGFLCPFGGTGSKTKGTYSGDVLVTNTGGGTWEVSGE